MKIIILLLKLIYNLIKLRWNAEEKGIMISFHKGKRVGESGEIQDENPVIIMDIKYKAKIFYPTKGKLIVGKLT